MVLADNVYEQSQYKKTKKELLILKKNQKKEKLTNKEVQ